MIATPLTILYFHRRLFITPAMVRLAHIAAVYTHFVCAPQPPQEERPLNSKILQRRHNTARRCLRKYNLCLRCLFATVKASSRINSCRHPVRIVELVVASTSGDDNVSVFA